jgi:hypothetical protein
MNNPFLYRRTSNLEAEMFAIQVHLLKYCADWLGSTGWLTVLLICTVAYLAIVKIALIRRLYVVAGRAAVHRAPTPASPSMTDLGTSRRSPENAAETQLFGKWGTGVGVLIPTIRTVSVR